MPRKDTNIDPFHAALFSSGGRNSQLGSVQKIKQQFICRFTESEMLDSFSVEQQSGQ